MAPLGEFLKVHQINLVLVQKLFLNLEDEKNKKIKWISLLVEYSFLVWAENTNDASLKAAKDHLGIIA